MNEIRDKVERRNKSKRMVMTADEEAPSAVRKTQTQSRSRDLSSRRGAPPPPGRNGSPKLVKKQRKGRGAFSSYMDMESNSKKSGTKRKSGSPVERERKGRGVFTNLNLAMDDDSDLVGNVDSTY